MFTTLITPHAILLSTQYFNIKLALALSNHQSAAERVGACKTTKMNLKAIIFFMALMTLANAEQLSKEQEDKLFDDYLVRILSTNLFFTSHQAASIETLQS